jgi:hypothetical protein
MERTRRRTAPAVRRDTACLCTHQPLAVADNHDSSYISPPPPPPPLHTHLRASLRRRRAFSSTWIRRPDLRCSSLSPLRAYIRCTRRARLCSLYAGVPAVLLAWPCIMIIAPIAYYMYDIYVCNNIIYMCVLCILGAMYDYSTNYFSYTYVCYIRCSH